MRFEFTYYKQHRKLKSYTLNDNEATTMIGALLAPVVDKNTILEITDLAMNLNIGQYACLYGVDRQVIIIKIS